MSNCMRHTRRAYQSSRSCYDKFTLGLLGRSNLCVNCVSFCDLPVKKKKQEDMGRRFQCLKPNVAEVPQYSLDVNKLSKRDTNVHNFEQNVAVAETESGPKKKRRVSPELKKSHLEGELLNVKQQLQNLKSKHTEMQLMYISKLADSLSEKESLQLEKEHYRAAKENFMKEVQFLESEKENMMKDIDDMKNEVKEAEERAERKMKQANAIERNAYRKVNTMENAHGMYSDPHSASSSLVKLLISKGFSDAEIASNIVSALCDRKKMRPYIVDAVMESPLGDIIKQDIESKMYKTIQDKFAAWKCLLHLDLSASVSFRGMDTIRRIEFYGTDNVKYKRGIFQERSKLSRISRQLERHGESILPFELTKNSVKFDIPQAATYLLKKYKLWDLVQNKQNVLLAATVDGGKLAWKLTQISAGIKIVDERSINPRTGELLFGAEGDENVQSSNHCFPLQVYIARDNKDFYNTKLTDFFSQMNKFEDDHSTGLVLAYPADMCSQCKTVRQGGAMKHSTYACYCCGIHRDDLAKPNQTSCPDCVRLGKSVCYHHAVMDEQLLLHLKDEKNDLETEWPHLARYPFIRSRIKFGNSGMGDGSADPRHIEYEPRTVQQRIQHCNLVREELMLRNISCNQYSGPEQRLLLHEVLLVEYRFGLLRGVLEAKTKEEAMIKLEKAVPCILHLENRISECFIRMLIIKALSYVEDDSHAIMNYIIEVERYVNEQIFGQPDAPSEWKFPYEENQLGEIKFSNWRARKIVEEIGGIVDLSIPESDPELRLQWKDAAVKYLEVIRLLRRRQNFTEAAIDQFQNQADDFFTSWLNIVGYDGVTNYVHMLGAGHIRYFLRRWGNLFKLQNQGWEQYNARVTSFWHHRTTKGGSKSDRSKILPIARWLLRLMLWRTGEGERFFKQQEQNQDNDGDVSDSDDSDNEF